MRNKAFLKNEKTREKKLKEIDAEPIIEENDPEK